VDNNKKEVDDVGKEVKEGSDNEDKRN